MPGWKPPASTLRADLGHLARHEPVLADMIVRHEEKLDRVRELVDSGDYRAANAWWVDAQRLERRAVALAEKIEAVLSARSWLTDAAQSAAKE